MHFSSIAVLTSRETATALVPRLGSFPAGAAALLAAPYQVICFSLFPPDHEKIYELK